ncbi:glycosyltransferase [Vibrio parahaemolyticus]|nr:glycosyltransferase [Vibrio parahaemolyticus]ELB2188088.1 glycosyltransferase [Vibrio parahaemolyticus]ELB2191310.1 glycosyltransferase [Vibrio parahaemolyticus]ELB2211914.1 glycosyltransferase [Vibrio parahaemolyticus]ELB2231767.1 glycosyltransferase [Vibrio parahaemolyticus]
MKVLHLISSLGIGGAEKFVVDLSKQMALENTVSVLVLDDAKDIGKDEKYASNLLHELECAGVKVYFVGANARSKPITIFTTLIKIIRTQKPDIIHSHLLIWSFFLSMIPFSSNKHIFTQHTNRLKLSWLHKIWLKYRIIGYVSICSNIFDTLDSKTKVTNIKQINNGVDLSRFPLSTRCSTSHKPLRFVTVSRLNDVKNHKLILDAVYLIKDKINIDFKVNIVGDGPMLSELTEIVRNNDISNYVDFLGQRSDISNILNQNDVFLLPSKAEGFSIALIEALSSGIDIIASDVGENRYILGDGLFGSIFESTDVEALANLMLSRIENGVMKRDFNLVSDHLQNFSISFSSNEHMRFYEETLQ